jgi:hypothetical protein
LSTKPRSSECSRQRKISIGSTWSTLNTQNKPNGESTPHQTAPTGVPCLVRQLPRASPSGGAGPLAASLGGLWQLGQPRIAPSGMAAGAALRPHCRPVGTAPPGPRWPAGQAVSHAPQGPAHNPGRAQWRSGTPTPKSGPESAMPFPAASTRPQRGSPNAPVASSGPRLQTPRSNAA